MESKEVLKQKQRMSYVRRTQDPTERVPSGQ